jgi:hypothetical protein
VLLKALGLGHCRQPFPNRSAARYVPVEELDWNVSKSSCRGATVQVRAGAGYLKYQSTARCLLERHEGLTVAVTSGYDPQSGQEHDDEG